MMMNTPQLDVLDSLDTGVLRVGFDSRVLQMNGAAEACLMVSRERAQGAPIQALLDLPVELKQIFDNRDSGEQVVRLHELKFPGGVFDCTIHVTRKQDWLLELHNLEWEQRRLRLQQREVQTGMLELLSRNLGHEVRNPLGGIRGAAQMLAEELDDGELAMLAQLIMRESDRIVVITDELVIDSDLICIVNDIAALIGIAHNVL